MITSRTVLFVVCAVTIVCVALLIGACVMRADVESIRQENTISVPSDSPGVDLRELAAAWREENRNAMGLR